MAGMKNIQEVVDSELEGRTRNYVWRKAPTQAAVAGIWFDESMSPGSPAAQYYIGNITTATALARSTDGGLQHGPGVSPANKYLRKINIMTASTIGLPFYYQLCDYLLFYPFIDMSITDQQDMTNVTTIPRYTTGAGVQMMAILTNPGVGGSTFTVTYTNQDGVGGRVTPNVTMNTTLIPGTVVTSAIGTLFRSGNPFMTLQKGDTGVRSIESITMLTSDVGLFTLVLVKPLCVTYLKEITAPYEKDFLLAGEIPRIIDDAYLNWLCLPQGSLSGAVHVGDLQVVWN